MNNRPLLTKVATDACGGDRTAGSELVEVLVTLLPLLLSCVGAKDDPAGWLNGGEPRVLPRQRAADIREALVLLHLRHHGIEGVKAHRIVDEIRRVTPADAQAMYKEAGVK